MNAWNPSVETEKQKSNSLVNFAEVPVIISWKCFPLKKSLMISDSAAGGYLLENWYRYKNSVRRLSESISILMCFNGLQYSNELRGLPLELYLASPQYSQLLLSAKGPTKHTQPLIQQSKRSGFKGIALRRAKSALCKVLISSLLLSNVVERRKSNVWLMMISSLENELLAILHSSFHFSNPIRSFSDGENWTEDDWDCTSTRKFLIRR